MSDIISRYLLHRRCSEEEEAILLCIERAEHLLADDPTMTINESQYDSAAQKATLMLKAYEGPLEDELKAVLKAVL